MPCAHVTVCSISVYRAAHTWVAYVNLSNKHNYDDDDGNWWTGKM